MRIRAAVCREFRAPLSVEEVELATAGPGEVTVKIAACAICHSDLTYISGGWGGVLPAVYGHEASGVVTEVGPGVAHVAPGENVVVTLIRSCGTCHYCAQGHQVQCETKFPLDRASALKDGSGAPLTQGLRTGAFAEAVTVHGSQIVAIPKEIPLDSASLLACGVITGLGAVTSTARVPAGATVVVIGCGGVGLNSVQGAALSGAAVILGIDLADDKLEAAKRFGATHVASPKHGDVVAAVKAATNGRGADYVFVTVGAKAAFEQAADLVAPVGTVVIVGMPPSDVRTAFDPGNFAHYGQRMLGSKMGSAKIAIDIPVLVDLYRQGRLKLDQLISGRYPLERINEALDSVRRGEALRHVIQF